jgi:hypothetical protein
LFSKETSVDGEKVRLRKEEGEGSHWLDYKAVRLHGSYYGAFFLDNQALINYVNSQPLSELLTCLGDGHDGIWNIIVELNPDQEFLDGTSPRIYPWNQSKIANRKSSSLRIYTWGQSKI